MHQFGPGALRAQLVKDDIFVPALLAAGLQPAGEPWGPEYLFYTLPLH